MIKEVCTTHEYYFETAWEALCENKVITSIKTGCSYKIDKSDVKEFKLKFYNPRVSWWQDCDYVLAKEMFGKWYITK
ncbi:hypothetical protein [Romboutsia sp.]|uniref:hypothetical protein n=1 Tax=Romboutsia sp. TaxID=1965302 RepID=UPI002D102C5B|nr:hypothetical protein [Romboutsia sp.]HSQ88827.1 hypothetical protein [Romboutsia sp.]